jgi:histone H3/H4
MNKTEIRKIIQKEAKEGDYWIFEHGVRISKAVIDYLADYKGAHALNEIIHRTVFVTFHSGMKTVKEFHVKYAVQELDREGMEAESEALDAMERGIVECETAYEEDSDYFLSVRGF